MAALPFVLADGAVAGEGWPCDVVAFQAENDEAVQTDRYYTGGLRAACTTAPPGWVDAFPWQPGDASEVQSRMTYSIGQNIYTPDDLLEDDPIEGEHPYAGWLYVGFGLDREVWPEGERAGHLDRIELQLGVVGPLSGAEQAQRVTHNILDASVPAGWDNQLDNEPGINLFLSRQWTGAARLNLTGDSDDRGLALDLTPVIGGALGNVHLFGAGGLALRFGRFDRRDHGQALIRPGIGGADGFPRHEGWSAYTFGGVEARVVGRNIFLDGNSFQDNGPSVDEKTLVDEVRAGLAFTYDRFRVAYTQVLRSREFDGQKAAHGFGSLTLALAL